MLLPPPVGVGAWQPLSLSAWAAFVSSSDASACTEGELLSAVTPWAVLILLAGGLVVVFVLPSELSLYKYAAPAANAPRALVLWEAAQCYTCAGAGGGLFLDSSSQPADRASKKKSLDGRLV